MFSLSYLPTAERLTVVVVKARNLKLDRENDNSPADNKITGLENVFVKVSSHTQEAPDQNKKTVSLLYKQISLLMTYPPSKQRLSNTHTHTHTE